MDEYLGYLCGIGSIVTAVYLANKYTNLKQKPKNRKKKKK